jgi:hypothetical protein
MLIIYVFYFTPNQRVNPVCSSLMYRKTKPEETEEEAHNGNNAIGIQTVDKKDPNVLQLESIQPRKRRAR